MRILFLAFLALAGCSSIPGLSGFSNPFDPTKLIEAMSKDPANVELQGTYQGGTVTYKRTNPNPVASCPLPAPTP